MARSATVFSCSSCGHESPKWHGRCPGCGEWNTLVEEARAAPAARAGGPGRGGRRSARALKPVALSDVQAPAVARLSTGIGELDRVLGGGLVPGSLVLIGGSPGIGKSTLTSGALGHLAAGGRRVLYVSGEESAAQVKLRAERLGRAALSVPIVAETDLDAVLATLEAERPEVCVIDSVQVLYDPALTGAPGSVGQVREVAGRIMRVAKELGIATLLVGHVTKEGSLAGPRVLEHLVDCVLSFEGERERTYRTLRALKNRFGSTNEVGVFEMARARPGRGGGRVAALRHRGHACAGLGRAVRDGGLAAAARGGPGAGGAQRAGAAAAGRQRRRPQPAGARAGRAVAPRRHRARARSDVFVSVAGGVRVDEPGADLAIALALASAAKGVELTQDKPLAAFGELGLTGELRHVAHADRRLAEAAKFGLTSVVRPGDRTRAALRQALRRLGGARAPGGLAAAPPSALDGA